MASTGEHKTPSVEEQLAALKQQLAEAQKLTALGELLSTTTHEFNNILMMIVNYAKMGIRHKDEATRDKSFEKILSASQRATKITSSILGVARNRTDRREATNIVKLVDDALVLLEREMNKYRVSVEKRFDDVPLALAVGNQIQQVLLNLLINARQAMPSGGTVFLTVSRDTEHNTVDIIVRDTGSGIPQEKLRRIFDPFYSTKAGPDESGKGGTGLGLSSCRDIIEAHKGRICVRSSVGKGTEFTLKLPTAEMPAAPIVAPIGAVAGEVVTGTDAPPAMG